MKPLKAYGLGGLLLVALGAALLAGCGGPKGRVEVLSNQHAVGLDADDMVRILRRAGFTDEQILEHGTDLRNALATAGAAQIRLDQKVEAIFAADGQYVRGSSRGTGSFTYDVKTHTFR